MTHSFNEFVDGLYAGGISRRQFLTLAAARPAV